MTQARGWRPTRRAARRRTRSRYRRPWEQPRSQPTWRPFEPLSSGTATRRRSEILPGGDALDLPAAAATVVFGEQRAHEHDALALLAGDLRPVVGIRRVRQVLVLAVLLPNGIDEVAARDASRAPADLPLDRHLLRAPDDVLDHRSGGEVLEEQHFLVTVLVRDLQEAVLVVTGVHAVHCRIDHHVDPTGPEDRRVDQILAV